MAREDRVTNRLAVAFELGPYLVLFRREPGTAELGDVAAKVDRERAAADALPRLQHHDLVATFGEVPSGAEAGETRPDNDDVSLHSATVDDNATEADIDPPPSRYERALAWRQSVAGWTMVNEFPSGSRSQNIGGTGPP